MRWFLLLSVLASAACLDPVCDSTGWECAWRDASVHPDAALSGDAASVDAALDAGAGDAGVRPDAARDGGSADAALPTDAGRADAAGFCEGPTAKVELAGVSRSISATGSVVYMDCCEGAEVILHTQGALGDVTSLFLTAPGASFPLREIPIGMGPDQPIGATATVGGAYFGSGISAAADSLDGTLGFTRNGDPATTPHTVRVCLTLRQRGGGPLDGARLYAPAAIVPAYGWSSRFRVHLLADPKLDSVEAATRPLSDLALDPEPLLNLDQTRYYRQEDGFLAFGMGLSLERLQGKLGPVPVRGRPFVIVADEERIYLGAFWTAMSSLSPTVPHVVAEEVTAKGATVKRAMVIGPDVRSDPRLVQTLRATGKLVE